MKKLLTLGLALLLAVALIVPTTFASSGQTPTLQELYDEERTAMLSYQKAIEQFEGKRPFSNIKRSEERHMGFVKDLAQEKGIVLTETEIVVEDYKDFNTAIDIAIEIEKEDISVLEEMLKEEGLDDQTKAVYERLLKGSQNHLRAFERVKDNNYQVPANEGKSNQRKNRQFNRENCNGNMMDREDCPYYNENANNQNRATDKSVFGSSMMRMRGSMNRRGGFCH